MSAYRGIRASLALGLLIGASTVAGSAAAQVRAGRLNNDNCIAEEFTSFDDVVMTATAAHFGGAGDVYQAICDLGGDQDCWGFSINRNAGVNALTTGITAGEYVWYVCAWNGSVRNVVANLAGGTALFSQRGPDAAAARVLELADSGIPEDIRRFASRLDRLPTVPR
jgi:hypothetical protein